MKNIFTLIICLCCCLFFSCQDYNEELIPLVGVYEGHVIGVTGPFSMSITLDTGNDVFVEAPFDGFEYSLVSVETRDQELEVVNLEFCDEEIQAGIWICGIGIFSNGSLQIDYDIDYGNFSESLTLVASKL